MTGPTPPPPDSDDRILAAVQAVLPAVRAVWLFGSHADGTARRDSDLDIAVMQSGRADVIALWQAGQDIACRLNIDVDLVDFLAASTVLQYEIVTRGRRLFACDPLEADLYEVFVLSEMTRLTEARAPLLADIKRTGRVYGR